MVFDQFYLLLPTTVYSLEANWRERVPGVVGPVAGVALVENILQTLVHLVPPLHMPHI